MRRGGGRSRTYKDIVNHLIPIFELAVTYAEDFSHHPGKGITQLLQCWNHRPSNLELEDREVKQLASHSTEMGINKATGKGAQALSPWK